LSCRIQNLGYPLNAFIFLNDKFDQDFIKVEIKYESRDFFAAVTTKSFP